MEELKDTLDKNVLTVCLQLQRIIDLHKIKKTQFISVVFNVFWGEKKTKQNTWVEASRKNLPVLFAAFVHLFSFRWAPLLRETFYFNDINI